MGKCKDLNEQKIKNKENHDTEQSCWIRGKASKQSSSKEQENDITEWHGGRKKEGKRASMKIGGKETKAKPRICRNQRWWNKAEVTCLLRSKMSWKASSLSNYCASKSDTGLRLLLIVLLTPVSKFVFLSFYVPLWLFLHSWPSSFCCFLSLSFSGCSVLSFLFQFCRRVGSFRSSSSGSHASLTRSNWE